MDEIKKYQKEIETLCKKHSVNFLYLFGSYARGDQKKDSDVDFLIDFKDVQLYDYFDNYYDFLKGLEKLLGQKVDLVSERYIENPYLKEAIDSEKVKIYDQRQNLAA